MKCLSSLLGLFIFFVLWLTTAYVHPMLLPTPWKILEAGEHEIKSGRLLILVYSSLIHYLGGACFGIVTALALGSLAGLQPRLAAFIRGLTAFLRPVPAIAWIPFAIVFFGVTHQAAAALVVSGVFWICFFAAENAIKTTNPDYIELARAFGYTKKSQQYTAIYMPASFPQLASAIRTAAGQAWTFLIAAELFGVTGIGQRIWEAAAMLANDIVVFYLLIISVLYIGSDFILSKLEKAYSTWK